SASTTPTSSGGRAARASTGRHPGGDPSRRRAPPGRRQSPPVRGSALRPRAARASGAAPGGSRARPFPDGAYDSIHLVGAERLVHGQRHCAALQLGLVREPLPGDERKEPWPEITGRNAFGGQRSPKRRRLAHEDGEEERAGAFGYLGVEEPDPGQPVDAAPERLVVLPAPTTDAVVIRGRQQSPRARGHRRPAEPRPEPPP